MSNMRELNAAIASCERCPERLVDHKWMPVGYFGAFQNANAWVVSINPSHREFLARDGHVLQGPHEQRFATLHDDLSCKTRPEFAAHHLPTVLDYQDRFFYRNPYRGFFNRLGSFLLEVHGVEDPEPLRPFRTSLPDGWLYCHMDIVKCATRHLWSTLLPSDRTLLRKHCQPYLAQQLEQAPQLRLILVNGRSAMESVEQSFAELDFRLTTETMAIGSSQVVIWTGRTKNYPDLFFLGWSANVVNGHLTTTTKKHLANLIRLTIDKERDAADRFNSLMEGANGREGWML